VTADKNKGKAAGEGDGVENVVDEQPKETADGTRVVRTEGRDFRVEGNVVDGYIGVSPEYRTYAQETEKPLLSDEDVELLMRSDTPTDVERLTMQSAGLVETAPDEEEDEAPSKVLSDENDESVKDTADKQGQGQAPGDPVSAETRNTTPKPASTTASSIKATETKAADTKAADKK
jgi:hypothetical protein